MKRVFLTGLAIMAAVVLRAQDATNQPSHQQSALTDAQKAELAQRADEMWNQLSPEAKIRLVNLHKALTGMPAEERHFIHERIERFLTMSPEDRERIKKNANRWHTMSPEEREQTREHFRQWRKDHPGQEPHKPAGSTNTISNLSEPKPNNQ
ncbi:MAG: DUF3106 domain-containing protein [Verrucomicrobiota bacterium]